MKDERPAQKINKHVPAFHLEASVRCQVSGTDAEVKANREKTVNTWLTAGILESQEEQDGGRSVGGSGYVYASLFADSKQVLGSRTR